MKLYHPSLECVQHGGKPLIGDGTTKSVLAFASEIGCEGVQLSHFHLLNPDGMSFVSAEVVQAALAAKKLKLSGISCHCLFWAHGAAKTGTTGVNKFIPKAMRGKRHKEIQAWAEARIHELMQLSASLGNYVMPMFWGPYWGLDVASGYPWGMWQGLPDADDQEHDLLAEGDERFLRETQDIRDHANGLGIVLPHEIHRGTGALCARDLLRLKDLTGDDPCVTVIADGSHCWENEDIDARFDRVGHLVDAVHVKDHKVVPGESLSSMEPDWKFRGMYFEKLGLGDLDLHRYVQIMMACGYPQRYRAIQKLPDDATVPLVVEAESAFAGLDEASTDGVAFVRENFCGDWATVSFEKAMGGGK
jgi:sugar phosphate isomerase/epimerase